MPLINYNIATGSLKRPTAAAMMEYWLAGNGAFVSAERQGLSACIPIANCSIAGLAKITPSVQMPFPLVPESLVLNMLRIAKSADRREVLFYLAFAEERWQLHVPTQLATATSVQPINTKLGTFYETALIEIHSHCSMKAQFSHLDNLEESGKFRIFGVLGEIFTRPALNVRVGVYNHFWQIPAKWIFELPSELADALET